jgi:hypothetical protein
MTRGEPDSAGGLSLQTLVISSIAAVAAAVVVPMIWQKGTLIATALTPLVVAIVSEALRKPAAVIGAATPRVTRRTAAAAPVPAPEPFDPLPPAERLDEPALAPDDPFGLRGARVTRSPRAAWWKLGLATGVLAFVIGAGAVTASELALFGSSVSDRGRTTLFGGAEPKRSDATPTPTATPTASPEASPTVTPTPTVEVTPTVTPAPTPVPGETPAVPTPAPTP